MRFYLIFFVWLASAVQVHAGAWPREKGQFFFSATTNFPVTEATQRPVHIDPSIYLEYGLNERLTIGVDAFTGDQGKASSAFLFLRHPIFEGYESRHALSYAIGARDTRLNSAETLARIGYSWGRGLETGWLSLDGSLTYSFELDKIDSKLDLGWGWRPHDRWATLMQIQTGTGSEGDFFAKLAPAVIWSATENVHFEFGAVKALTGDQGIGLRLGTWYEF